MGIWRFMAFLAKSTCGLSRFNVIGGQTSSGMISKGKVSRTVSSHGEISHLALCCAA